MRASGRTLRELSGWPALVVAIFAGAYPVFKMAPLWRTSLEALVREGFFNNLLVTLLHDDCALHAGAFMTGYGAEETQFTVLRRG